MFSFYCLTFGYYEREKKQFQNKNGKESTKYNFASKPYLSMIKW